jgi:hypothetical protein
MAAPNKAKYKRSLQLWWKVSSRHGIWLDRCPIKIFIGVISPPTLKGLNKKYKLFTDNQGCIINGQIEKRLEE